jgi:hypothetical protein
MILINKLNAYLPHFLLRNKNKIRLLLMRKFSGTHGNLPKKFKRKKVGILKKDKNILVMDISKTLVWA